jgi:D-3-phosphoglycerate dehydrogenase
MGARVVITDANYPDLEIERAIFESANVRMDLLDAETPEDIIEGARGADGLVTQYATISESVFEAVPSLEVVARYGVGLDNVDVEAATAHDVYVVNDTTYCTEEVATHAVSFLLAALRRLPIYDASVDAGNWDWTEGRPISRLSELTLGLIGFGRIARQVAATMQTFDLDVVSYDPYASTSLFAEHSVEQVSFETLCERADAVSVHTPLTDETVGLVGRQAFERASVLEAFVNTSRGEVVDSSALASALDAGDVRCACVDVLPQEPPVESPLVGREDVLVTPHSGWYSESSIVELRHNIASNVVAVLQGKTPSDVVNATDVAR